MFFRRANSLCHRCCSNLYFHWGANGPTIDAVVAVHLSDACSFRGYWLFFFYSERLDIEGPLLPILSQLSTAGAERFVRTNRIVSSLACDCLTHKQAVPLLWKVIRSIYVNIYSLYVLAFELKMCITEGIFPRQKKKSSKWWRTLMDEQGNRGQANQT